MRYLGGKSRIAKRLCAALPDADRVWEPFCGGLNMTLELAKRYSSLYASDLHPGPIALGRWLQAGWAPPTAITSADYHAARALPDTSPLKAFIGFGCSFSGKWFAGPNLPKTVFSEHHPRGMRQDAPLAAHNFCVKIGAQIDHVLFEQQCFFEKSPEPGLLIYCDPPYANTTDFVTGVFPTQHFLTRCAEHVRAGSRVFVSEYADLAGSARLVWAHTGYKSMHGIGGQAVRTEKLFEIL